MYNVNPSWLLVGEGPMRLKQREGAAPTEEEHGEGASDGRLTPDQRRLMEEVESLYPEEDLCCLYSFLGIWGQLYDEEQSQLIIEAGKILYNRNRREKKEEK